MHETIDSPAPQLIPPFTQPLLLAPTALVLFGPPETVTAFVRNQRGQGPSHVDDDWLCILSYTSPSPLPPDSAAPGTRIGGLRAVLGATCLSAHIDAEQPRFRVEGTRGSYEKRGTDPQENQLKAGQTPSSHPDTFGLYEPDTPHSLSHGRLTTSADATPGKAPVLAVSDIPTLPGRYVDFYANVAEAIGAGAGASALDRLAVKPEQVADATRILELARKSANEGRTVRWDEKED